MVDINIATAMPAFRGRFLSGAADHRSLLLHDATGSLLIPLANLVEMMRYPRLQIYLKSFKPGELSRTRVNLQIEIVSSYRSAEYFPKRTRHFSPQQGSVKTPVAPVF